ncbi:hypothetical protein YC2023_046833 [Brassica napus]
MIATSTVKFARELDPNDRHLKSDMTRSRVGLEIQIGTKVKIVNGEDEESKSRDQSDMPRIRSTSEESQEDKILLLEDKDRYKIHGFYKNISVVNRPNTRCVSTVSILLHYGCWLARCKNHLWRSVTANIEGEQLPGPIVTCNSAFGGTFYAGSSAGGSAPANDSEVEQEASIQDLVANTCQILAPCCFSSPIIYVA